MTLSKLTPYRVVTYTVILACAVFYVWSGSYLRIMTERQVQSLAHCTFGSNSFESPEYGFSFKVPASLCILPARLYPRDGIIEVLPKGFYFVVNEYAHGSIARATQATILIEALNADRTPEKVVQNLLNGKFLDPKNISTKTSKLGLQYTELNGVLGIDGALYDWAIFSAQDQKHFFAVLTRHIEGKSLYSQIVDSFSLEARKGIDFHTN